MDDIKWGIIGCGDVTEVKSGPAFSKIPGSSLIAVMRRDGEKAKDYAERHHVSKWYSDAQQLIDDPDVNAVYVATPPDTHAKFAIAAVMAGKPVYVEKPMARNYQECKAILDAAEKFNVPVFTAFYRRRLPSFMKVKELADNGSIGKIRLVNIQLYQAPQPGDYNNDALPWRVIPEKAGGGYFVDLAAHQLDFLDYVFGEITEIKAFRTNQAGLYPAEDLITASFLFKNGIAGSGSWCFTTSEQADTDVIEIIGEKGKIIFHTFGNTEVELITSSGKEVYSFDNPAHIQQPLIETVVNAITGKGECPSTGVSGSRTSWVMDKMLGKI